MNDKICDSQCCFVIHSAVLLKKAELSAIL